MKYLLYLLILTPIILFAQKKPLSESEYNTWNSLRQTAISADGSVLIYTQQPNRGNPAFFVHDFEDRELLSYPRADRGSISWDSEYVAFLIHPDEDTVREMKRSKLFDEDEMPKDTLALFQVNNRSLRKFAPVKDYRMPSEWDGLLAFRLDEVIDKEDTVKSKAKKPSSKNGYHLVLFSLENETADTIPYVTEYRLAEEGKGIILQSTGQDSSFDKGVYYYHAEEGRLEKLMAGDLKWQNLSISKDAGQVAFLVDTDTTDARVKNHQLVYWNATMDTVSIVADTTTLPGEWMISEHRNLYFSDSGNRLFFGIATPPVLADTSLLDDEIVQVEVWNYKDQRLMPQQLVELDGDKKKNYLAHFDTKNRNFILPSDETVPYLSLAKGNDNRYAVGSNNEQYLKYTSWEGFPVSEDVYLVDLQQGNYTEIRKNFRGSNSPSPGDRYVLFYNTRDTLYEAYDISTGQVSIISDGIPTSLTDEEDDHPDYPSPYGVAGWTKNDESIIIYDRYDLWQVNLKSPAQPRKLTNGRDSRTVYRYVSLDPDERFIDTRNMVLSTFNEVTKDDGYALLGKNGRMTTLISSPHSYGSLTKARQADRFMFTRESNMESTNMYTATETFNEINPISDINPQQAGFIWSTVELIEWNSLDGKKLQGLLYKPENFDPNKKYPMMTYFYERNSDNLHRYWGATPIRSIINPNYYASRGYVVFIPDITYIDGYPGESCYDAVIPGVTYMIDQGYIDKDRIGVQGHSWGGYQTAYLVTKTDIFACAESGAPVSNMVSAYGGIRWGSGLSRMFQYEHTQSRIGGTLWEYPLRYIENSPIFFADKINTPLLLMHNDEDTAVPWYQGIEFFVALRRLNKPVWMLNYTGEPHWPTKWENIIDFNIRMQQFFDHYLMGEEMPMWMDEGIPATLQGIEKGY